MPAHRARGGRRHPAQRRAPAGADRRHARHRAHRGRQAAARHRAAAAARAFSTRWRACSSRRPRPRAWPSRCARDGRAAAVVRADEKRLRQILINLLGNAVKFTDSGSVTLRLDHAREVARFEIEDTGPGIAPQDLERIFLPFERGSAGRRAGEPGTGLGLTITQLLTELMGGEMTVRSAPGQGSTFTVRLFLQRDRRPGYAPHAAAPRRSAATSARAAALLVVDDDPTQRQLLAGMLLPLGFRRARGRQRPRVPGERARAAARRDAARPRDGRHGRLGDAAPHRARTASTTCRSSWSRPTRSRTSATDRGRRLPGLRRQAGDRVGAARGAAAAPRARVGRRAGAAPIAGPPPTRPRAAAACLPSTRAQRCCSSRSSATSRACSERLDASPNENPTLEPQLRDAARAWSHASRWSELVDATVSGSMMQSAPRGTAPPSASRRRRADRRRRAEQASACCTTRSSRAATRCSWRADGEPRAGSGWSWPPPDAILLDARDAGPDGFETCRRIKAHRDAGAHPGDLHDRPVRDRRTSSRASRPAASTTSSSRSARRRCWRGSPRTCATRAWRAWRATRSTSAATAC